MLQTQEWKASPATLRPAEGWHLKSASNNHGFSTCEPKGLNCVTKMFPLNLHFYEQLNCLSGIRDVYKQVSFPPSFTHVKPELHFSLKVSWHLSCPLKSGWKQNIWLQSKNFNNQGMIYHAPIHDGNLSWEEALLVDYGIIILGQNIFSSPHYKNQRQTLTV